MGINVTTCTVWFAVCPACSRERMAAGIPAGSSLISTVMSFPSQLQRGAGLDRHREETGHLSSAAVIWEVTAGDPVA